MSDSIEKIHKTQLEILEAFKSICKKHGLRYYAIGGTLIGVHRHKGFIPWDDDIDLGMPRPDFDKFVALQKEYPKGYTLTNHENVPEWQFNLCQFVDSESEIIERLNELPRKCNIWIDIFPIDGMPANQFRRWLHAKHIMYYRYLVQMANLKTQVNVYANRPWYEHVVLKLLRYIPMGKMVNVDWALKKMEKVLRKYDFDKSGYAGNMLGRKREYEAVPRSWWNGPVEYPFENTTIASPDGYDAYLTHIYGNYMQMPSEDKRECHYIEIVKLREQD